MATFTHSGPGAKITNSVYIIFIWLSSFASTCFFSDSVNLPVYYYCTIEIMTANEHKFQLSFWGYRAVMRLFHKYFIWNPVLTDKPLKKSPSKTFKNITELSDGWMEFTYYSIGYGCNGILAFFRCSLLYKYQVKYQCTCSRTYKHLRNINLPFLSPLPMSTKLTDITVFKV